MNIITDDEKNPDKIIKNLEVFMCLGLNDLNRIYSREHILTEYLKTAVEGIREFNPYAKITLVTIPQFDLNAENERIRRYANSSIPALDADYVFDIRNLLSTDSPLGADAKYGPHPNANGGLAVFEDFKLGTITDKKLRSPLKMSCKV